MEEIHLSATLKKAKSKKNEDYYYVSLLITDNVEKKVFLDPAEVELIRMIYND